MFVSGTMAAENMTGGESRHVQYDGDTDSDEDMLFGRKAARNLNEILEIDGEDEDALKNIMVHLEEKQKKREQEKIGEDFEGIKSRMDELLGEYSDPDEEFEMMKLTDPDSFISNESKEKAKTQNGIDELLYKYSELCREREDILGNVFDALDFESTTRDLKSPALEEVDNISSEISMTIELINQSSNKLNKLYNRLVKLYAEKSQTVGDDKIKNQLRELDLQKQVIGKFKMLHGQNVKRREKVDTWKYAANEIVDLLKSVRKEGATDFERLEKEFKKLVQAFTAQGELVADQQHQIERQRQTIHKVEAMKEKFKNDNLLLQDEYDRTRVNLKTTQMQVDRLERDYKETREKLSQVQYSNNVVQGGDSEIDPIADSKVLDVQASTKIKNLEAELDRVEQLLKKEQLKTKELKEKRGIDGWKNSLDVVKSGFRTKSSINSSAVESTISVDLEKEVETAAASVHMDMQQKIRKCIKCNSYKSRIKDLMDELNTRKTQVQHLSNAVEEKTKKIEEQQERIAQMNDSKISSTPIRRLNNTPNVPSPRGVEDVQQRDLSSSFSETNDEYDEVRTATATPPTVITSSKQIVVFQNISVNKCSSISNTPQQDAPKTAASVSDVSTQTDFPIEKQIEIVRQRSSLVPTQHVIPKNYSSVVDEDIKSMASRIYSYVNTIKHRKYQLEDINENEGSAGNTDTDKESKKDNSAETSDGQQTHHKHRTENDKKVERDSIPNAGLDAGAAKDDAKHTSTHDTSYNKSEQGDNTEHRSDSTQPRSHSESSATPTNLSGGEDTNSNKVENARRGGSSVKHSEDDVGSPSRQGSRKKSAPRNDVNSNKNNEVSNLPSLSDAAIDEEHHQEKHSYLRRKRYSISEGGQRRRLSNAQHVPGQSYYHYARWDPQGSVVPTQKEVHVVSIDAGVDKQDQDHGLGGGHQENINKTSNRITTSDQDKEEIQRNGNESGFFDESTGEQQTSLHWQKVRSGVINHVLRFLNNKAKNKCSHLQSKIQYMDFKNKTDEEIVANELTVFAEHAIDMLDVISYTVKQMNERDIIPPTITEQSSSMLARIQSQWEPQISPVERRVKFDQDNEKANDGLFPDIVQHRSGSAKKQTKEGESVEMMAKVAEKKRQKILDRHKKLVDRLRASGVGLKQIYTILGIR